MLEIVPVEVNAVNGVVYSLGVRAPVYLNPDKLVGVRAVSWMISPTADFRANKHAELLLQDSSSIVVQGTPQQIAALWSLCYER